MRRDGIKKTRNRRGLVEINASWAPDGAGMTVSGPSLRALRTIGVLDEVLRLGGSWRSIDSCGADGKVLINKPRAPDVGADDLPGAGRHHAPRAGRYFGQATRAPGAKVRLGVVFTDIAQDDAGAT